MVPDTALPSYRTASPLFLEHSWCSPASEPMNLLFCLPEVLLPPTELPHLLQVRLSISPSLCNVHLNTQFAPCSLSPLFYLSLAYINPWQTICLLSVCSQWMKSESAGHSVVSDSELNGVFGDHENVVDSGSTDGSRFPNECILLGRAGQHTDGLTFWVANIPLSTTLEKEEDQALKAI